MKKNKVVSLTLTGVKIGLLSIYTLICQKAETQPKTSNCKWCNLSMKNCSVKMKTATGVNLKLLRVMHMDSVENLVSMLDFANSYNAVQFDVIWTYIVTKRYINQIEGEIMPISNVEYISYVSNLLQNATNDQNFNIKTVVIINQQTKQTKVPKS